MAMSARMIAIRLNKRAGRVEWESLVASSCTNEMRSSSDQRPIFKQNIIPCCFDGHLRMWLACQETVCPAKKRTENAGARSLCLLSKLIQRSIILLDPRTELPIFKRLALASYITVLPIFPDILHASYSS